MQRALAHEGADTAAFEREYVLECGKLELDQCIASAGQMDG